MAGGTAMGAAALAVASAAQSAADDAKCRVVIKTFDAVSATLEQRREYAGCVYRIDGSGEPLGAEAALAVKFLIVASFVAAGIGAVIGWRDDGLMLASLGALLGACVPWLIAGALFLAIAGIAFVVGH